jgi:hypothetical protein
MPTTFKQLTDFLVQIGASDVAHAGGEKMYLAHAIGVYSDLKKFGCDEDVARVGVFHSIYGTELFQRFTLPLTRRGEVRDLIGERAERLSYYNCAMDRTHFDGQVTKPSGPYSLLDRFQNTETVLSDQDFNDLCTVHLVDWLEQVERSGNWSYRRDAYHALARRLGPAAEKAYDAVYAEAPAA